MRLVVLTALLSVFAASIEESPASCGCSDSTQRPEADALEEGTQQLREEMQMPADPHLKLGQHSGHKNQLVAMPGGYFFFGTNNPKIPYVRRIRIVS
jgi:hypothetical protein